MVYFFALLCGSILFAFHPLCVFAFATNRDWLVDLALNVLDNPLFEELASSQSADGVVRLFEAHHLSSQRTHDALAHSSSLGDSSLQNIALKTRRRQQGLTSFVVMLNNSANTHQLVRDESSFHRMVKSLDVAHGEFLSRDYGIIIAPWSAVAALRGGEHAVALDVLAMHPWMKFTVELAAWMALHKEDHAHCGTDKPLTRSHLSVHDNVRRRRILRSHSRSLSAQDTTVSSEDTTLPHAPAQDTTRLSSEDALSAQDTLSSSPEETAVPFQDVAMSLEEEAEEDALILQFALLTPEHAEDFQEIERQLHGIVRERERDGVAARLSLETHDLPFRAHSVVSGRVHVRSSLSPSLSAQRLPPCEALSALATDLATEIPSLFSLSLYAKPQSVNKYTRALSTNGSFFEQDDSLSRSAFSALQGADQVVAVTDTGLDLFSCFFHDSSLSTSVFAFQTSLSRTVLNTAHRKVVQYVSFVDALDDSGGHGTHVAGSVAGCVSENSELSVYNGMAPLAKIAFFDIGRSASSELYTPDNLNTGVFQVLYQSGARIFSNSWGSFESSYTQNAAQTDLFMWTFKDALVLYAAGNSGIYGAGTVISPATSKSALSVGASSSDEHYWARRGQTFRGLHKQSVAYFSSWGPTLDGRLKPDVVVPGYFTISAAVDSTSSSQHCAVKGLAGTSMATPALAGLLARVREYFLRGYYPRGAASTSAGFTPSGALLKAVAVHSARRMSSVTSTSQLLELTAYPSIVQGYGRVVLEDVLYFSQGETEKEKLIQPLFVVGSAWPDRDALHVSFSSENETHRFLLTTASTVRRTLRVTLCFSDYPGSPLSADATVNSLRVVVYPSLLCEGDESNSLGECMAHRAYGAAEGERERERESVQRVDVWAPLPDTQYTVAVTATALGVGPQPYALVVTGDLVAGSLSHEPRRSQDSLPPRVEDSLRGESASEKSSDSMLKERVAVSLTAVVLALGAAACMWFSLFGK